ncbi:hypothetical protein MF621_004072 (plasmid) [Bacillus velezensis]|uniref:hypothetical protein n=1 Tax=Bacillus velezensis TaxID=492670 RepID=UPI00049FD1A9|nr:hypothetical protein [Bacillus velezensis]KDN91270.1 hypothetical protein EF87_19750 [Bacillus amyloliquefaciens]URJ76365.1 hypothetical protein MF619_004110 [Bacillus velezensis]URJ80485.1 hypothetical protein MF621_004072 [Bacillus velezensis]
MITITSGKAFNGRLKAGQVWVKGKNERVIHSFNDTFMYYQTKKGVKEGRITAVLRSSFRNWVYSGAMLKDGVPE